MKWSRELRIARRSVRTAIKAASAMASANAKLPASVRLPLRSAGLPPRPSAELVELSEFGSNPGRLSMFVHRPPNAPRRDAPLIVLLHGCGQSASGFARDAGWIALAEKIGVPLVLPEQSGENNHGRCFNWFRPAHTARGSGEALSIREMVATAIERFAADPKRVFIAGLSAGGAMTAALLAAYPDVFAGGAVVAGLPVGAASSTSEALRRMAEAGPDRSPSASADQVRRTGPDNYRGPWPRLSIWHGQSDRVVDPLNGDLLAMQWSALHGVGPEAPETAELLGMRRDRWVASGRTVVELWSLSGLAHDWPPGAVESIADFWDIAAD
jgi:poly(hydroxyalkanoate) depolymerase family esterase